MNGALATLDKEKIVKMLRLAVDPRTMDTESQAAFLSIRRTGASWDDVVSSVLEYSGSSNEWPRKRVSTPPPRPAWWYREMPFGKYVGQSLGSVSQKDPDYLAWLVVNAQKISQSLREDIKAALNER